MVEEKRCKICGFQTTDRTYMRKHLKKEHGKNNNLNNFVELPSQKKSFLQRIKGFIDR